MSACRSSHPHFTLHTQTQTQFPMFSPVLIIACGGKSERMGIDKCLLNYHGLPQYLHLQKIFKPHFPEIYFSIRKEQFATFSAVENTIPDIDQFAGHGPISGLLSCATTFPDRSILFIGCDYPLLSVNDILKLTTDFKNENPTAYFNEFYEPLLAYYSINSLDILTSEFEKGNFSLQNFLAKISTNKILADDIRRIKSIDTKEEFDELLTEINKIS